MPPFHISAEVLGDALQLVPGSLQPSWIGDLLGTLPRAGRVAHKVGKGIFPEGLGELFHEVQLVLRALERFRTVESQKDVSLQGLEARRKSWLKLVQVLQELAQAPNVLYQRSRWYGRGDRR
jgi:hypothetical protein